MRAKFPQAFKFKKNHKVAIYSPSLSISKMPLGVCGLVSSKTGFLAPNQIETIKRAATKRLKHFVYKARIWLRPFPTLHLTKKPLQTRMGKGKGNPYQWVAPIRKGQILLEVFLTKYRDYSGLPFLPKLLARASAKSPFVTKKPVSLFKFAYPLPQKRPVLRSLDFAVLKL